LGHPSKFQPVSRLAVVTAATPLTGGSPNFARCLAVSWLGTLYIHFRGLLPPVGILSGAKFTLRSSLAFSYIGSLTARHSRSGRQPNFAAWYHGFLLWEVRAHGTRNFRTGRHLYSFRRPSRWASAHILVKLTLKCLNR